MKKITKFLATFLILSLLIGCGGSGNELTKDNLQSKTIGPQVGSVYWSPYHHDGNTWVGPIVYYLFSENQCLVRASGIHNRFGGERIGHVVNWKINDSIINIEGHELTIIGDEVLKSNQRIFFKSNSLSEAYELIYAQSTTTVAN